MKKKIIFMIYSLSIGGTEKALLNLISEFPFEEYDITILMLENKIEFLNSIPEEVSLEYVEEYNIIKNLLGSTPKIIAVNLLKRGELLKALSVLFVRLLSKMLKNRIIYYNFILRDIPKIEKEYDTAVAYAGPNDLISYFVIKKIKSKKKIQWIHTDVSKIEFDKNYTTKIYKKFDKVFVVSNEAKQKLINLIPSIKKKTKVFYNIISKKHILSELKRGEGFIDNFDGIRILTVGRLSEEKGQDLAILTLEKLVKNGYKVKWYCLGEGDARGAYEHLIRKYNLQEKFILLGSNPNPYPFISECDIYVQPSRHEGYCITLAEARCLNKPIVTTKFTGASEQITNENNGLIVSINENEIYEAVRRLVINSDLRNELSTNLKCENAESSSNIHKISNL